MEPRCKVYDHTLATMPAFLVSELYKQRASLKSSL